jgi:hypothetical protein
VQTEAERARNDALFAVEVLLTASAVVEVGFYVNIPGGVVDPRLFDFRHFGLVAMCHPPIAIANGFQISPSWE